VRLRTRARLDTRRHRRPRLVPRLVTVTGSLKALGWRWGRVITVKGARYWQLHHAQFDAGVGASIVGTSEYTRTPKPVQLSVYICWIKLHTQLAQ
jgi:hypothetical protein